MIKDGHFYSRYPNGNIQIVENYSNGKKDGLINGYVENYNEDGVSISMESHELGV